MKKSSWVWMPHPAHFICANDCRFVLATCVGDYIVSTVGEYVPPDSAMEIIARSRGITLSGKGDARRADYMRQVGFETIGCDRLYESMVFPAEPWPDNHCGCAFRPSSLTELDFKGYNSPHLAVQGHMELCQKWSKAKPPREEAK